MQNYQKVFNLSNEKNAKKVYTGLDNGCGRDYLNDFMEEAKSATALDLPNASLMITQNYVCNYAGVKNGIYILPIKDIVNVYMSNCFHGNFQYDTKAIALEMRDGQTYYYASQLRNQKVPQATQAFDILVGRCKMNEGSLLA